MGKHESYNGWTDDEIKIVINNPRASKAELWELLGGKHTADACQKRKETLRKQGKIPAPTFPLTNGPVRMQRLGKIADLLEKSGIDPEDIGKVERVRLNDWQGFYKDADGVAHKVDMEASSVVLSPKWEEGPEWPVVQPGKPVTVRSHPIHSTHRTDGMKVAVILPDLQIGWHRSPEGGEATPMHDESALEVSLQILRQAQPDKVIMLGDNVDLAEMGKYRQQPIFQQTVQKTIDRATLYIGQIRAEVGPGATIDWVEGNHEKRLANYILDNASAAFGLKQGNLPNSWPVLSIPLLCRLDEFGVTYVAGYPANEIWLSDRLRCVHGDKARANSNFEQYLNEERASTIYAHTHRREWGEKTRHTRQGPRTIMAANPGCLCRIDGAVPGSHSGYDVNGNHVTRWENWQQGMAVISYTEDDGPFSYEPIPIHHGIAYWRGQKFTA